MTIPTVDETKRIIAEKAGMLRAMHIANLYLYGSVARGLADENSDYDFIFEMEKGLPGGGGRRESQSRSADFMLEFQEQIFHRPCHTFDISLPSKAFLSSVLPHSVLVLGDKSVERAYQEYCEGKMMTKNKFADIGRVLDDALGVIGEIRTETAGKNPRDFLPDNTPEKRKNIVFLEKLFSNLNDALNRASMKPFKAQIADVTPEKFWKDLKILGVACRHIYAQETLGASMDLAGDFCDNGYLDTAENGIRKMRDIVRG